MNINTLLQVREDLALMNEVLKINIPLEQDKLQAADEQSTLLECEVLHAEHDESVLDEALSKLYKRYENSLKKYHKAIDICEYLDVITGLLDEVDDKLNELISIM